MLTAYKFGKLLAKNAADNVFEGRKGRTDAGGVLPSPQYRTPALDRQTAQSIVDAMASQTKYDALKDVRVGLGSNPIRDYYERHQANPRVWNIFKRELDNLTLDGRLRVDTGLTPNDGDFYLYKTHDVALPSRDPGVLVHELGHAVDFNEYPTDSTLRHLIGGAYREYAPTLWTEHAAWRKGRDKFLRGAAQQKLDPALVQNTLQSMSQTKPVGLGSYWGAGLGTLAGGGLGLLATSALAAGRSRSRGDGPPFVLLPTILGLGLGGVAGGMTGSFLGSLYGHSPARATEKARLKHLDTYANYIAKAHSISKEEALAEIKNKLENITKKKRAA